MLLSFIWRMCCWIAFGNLFNHKFVWFVIHLYFVSYKKYGTMPTGMANIFHLGRRFDIKCYTSSRIFNFTPISQPREMRYRRQNGNLFNQDYLAHLCVYLIHWKYMQVYSIFWCAHVNLPHIPCFVHLSSQIVTVSSGCPLKSIKRIDIDQINFRIKGYHARTRLCWLKNRCNLKLLFETGLNQPFHKHEIYNVC